MRDDSKNGVKVLYWSPDKLKPYGRTPRRHEAAVGRMVETIGKVGFRIPVLALADGRLIDGHLRLKAAQELGLKAVPVILVDDLTEVEIKALRISINKAATFATWDYDLLAEEFDGLSTESFEVGWTGFDPAEIGEVYRMVDLDDEKEGKVYLNKEDLNHDRSVKVVLPIDTLDIFEKALKKTGLENRSEAVKIICEVYLDK